MSLKDFFEYKWKYIFSKILSPLYKNKKPPEKYLFITHNDTRGWILEAKAKRLSKYCPLPSMVYYSDSFRNLPDSAGYFFLHQKYFARALKYNPGISKRKNIVMFTHPEWSRRYSALHMAYVLKFADRVICLNSSVHKELVSLGVDPDKLLIYHMASDPDMFKPKVRAGNGCIGLCMNYNQRKNPDLMVDIIKKMPDKEFLLIGPNWKKFPRFSEIENLPNFTYTDVSYEDYPALYQKMDVFVSTSYLEGGPVPLLEAMLSNIVPVVSATGFAPDLIKHGENGFLFDPMESSEHVIELIHKAFSFKGNVREKVVKHSWKDYGRKIGGLFDGMP